MMMAVFLDCRMRAHPEQHPLQDPSDSLTSTSSYLFFSRGCDSSSLFDSILLSFTLFLILETFMDEGLLSPAKVVAGKVINHHRRVSFLLSTEGCVSQHAMGRDSGCMKGAVKGVQVVNFWYNLLLWSSGVAFWFALLLWPSVMAFWYGIQVWPSGVALCYTPPRHTHPCPGHNGQQVGGMHPTGMLSCCVLDHHRSGKRNCDYSFF